MRLQTRQSRTRSSRRWRTAALYWACATEAGLSPRGKAGDRSIVSDQSRQRRTVHYSGRVQGVGFRFTAVRVAGEFAVDGFVKNLPDGRVLLVAEGNRGELDRFLAAIASEMGGNIRTVAVEPGEATGELSGFGVQY